MEVQNLRPSYWKFLLRLTKGRCVLVEIIINKSHYAYDSLNQVMDFSIQVCSDEQKSA